MKNFEIIYSGLTGFGHPSFGLTKKLLRDRVSQKWVVQYDDYFGPESLKFSSFSEAVAEYREL